MKITKTQLKEIIKEELGALAEEPEADPRGDKILLAIAAMAKERALDKFDLMVKGDAAAGELGDLVWRHDDFNDLVHKSGLNYCGKYFGRHTKCHYSTRPRRILAKGE
jgi:hypothetical protein